MASDTSKASSEEHVEKQKVTAGKEPSAHHVEKLGALRIDGDDLDHEHEPKVPPVFKVLVDTDLLNTREYRCLSEGS